MGNDQGSGFALPGTNPSLIPPGTSEEFIADLRKRFHYHDDELKVIHQTFADLAKRSPGDVIDKPTFLKFFPLPGLLGERLFTVFDSKHTGVVDFEEFLQWVLVGGGAGRVSKVVRAPASSRRRCRDVVRTSRERCGGALRGRCDVATSPSARAPRLLSLPPVS